MIQISQKRQPTKITKTSYAPGFAYGIVEPLNLSRLSQDLLPSALQMDVVGLKQQGEPNWKSDVNEWGLSHHIVLLKKEWFLLIQHYHSKWQYGKLLEQLPNVSLCTQWWNFLHCICFFFSFLLPICSHSGSRHGLAPTDDWKFILMFYDCSIQQWLYM